MNFPMKPDSTVVEEKTRIGRVPTLVVRPARRPLSPFGLLWIHGGGYITGMKEMVYMSRGADFARDFGMTVFSPGYRLAWLHPYPAALEDCFSVLEYMHAHHQALGFRHILVGGESAGGGLCAAVCMMARDRGIPVSFQIPLYPMLSHLDTESSRDNHGRVWNTRKNHLAWRVYLRGTAKRDVSPYASPALQTDFRNLPPCYTFVGQGEPFCAETLQYAARLRTAGVEAEADVYPSDLHAFDMLDPDSPVSREAVRKLHTRMETVLSDLLKKDEEENDAKTDHF